MANLAVAGRWLRVKKSGAIYPYNEHLANNPAVEEVPEELAFPERFVPPSQKSRKPQVDLGTAEEVVAEAEEPKKPKAGLAADAGQGLVPAKKAPAKKAPVKKVAVKRSGKGSK